MAGYSILQRLADDEQILPYLELSLASENWPDYYTIEVDSTAYSGNRDGYMHASSDWSKGALYLYYKIHPDHKDHIQLEKRTLSSNMTLAMGSALHAVIQTQLKMAGLLKEEDIEVPFQNDTDKVRGNCDGILTLHDGSRKIFELKALDVNTLILTDKGWSTMGALTDYDKVYAPDGTLTSIKAHPIRFQRPCYELTFADGQKIIADEDHLWEVDELYKSSGERYRRAVYTTKQLVDAGIRKGRSNFRFRVDVTEALQMPGQDLPIDPWLLGEWLGDGTQSDSMLTVGNQDVEYLENRLVNLGLTYSKKWRKTAWGIYPLGVRKHFVSLGLLNNKHIPDIYMKGSIKQRSDLLAGLLDSDGTISNGRQVSICQKNQTLAIQILELVRSLGYRATFSESYAKLNGEKKGLVYWIKFHAGNPRNPFQMPRKYLKYEAFEKGKVGSHDIKKNAIVSIESVSSRPTRCISVDHPSSLFLVGQGFVPTHNTQNSRAYNFQSEPKDSWLGQCQIYMHEFGLKEAIMIIAESGYPYRLREFRIQYDPEWIEKYYGKFRKVIEAVEKSRPPDVPCCQMNSPEMKKCPMRSQCWFAKGEEPPHYE